MQGSGGQVRSLLPRTVGPERDSGYSCCMPSPRAVLTRGALALALAAMLVVACANDVESQGQPNAGGPADLATNLDVPWGIAFLPDGSALIAERNSGTIRHMSAPGEVNLVGSVAGVAARGKEACLVLPPRGRRYSPTSRRARTTAWCGCASRGARCASNRRFSPVFLPVPSTTADAWRSARTASCM